MMRDLPFRSSR